MKAVIQRVRRASVEVGGKAVAETDHGLVIFIGIKKGDQEKDALYLARKIAELRLFEDKAGHIHLNILETGGEALVISQFTLYADCRKGRRPSFVTAESPEKAEILYRLFIRALAKNGVPLQEGVFRKMMEVSFINDGPFTLILES
jgi:D-tyrosyl-tRNA(Tyr) deacylase